MNSVHNAEKCEYLAENDLLEFQKAWNVFSERTWSCMKAEEYRKDKKNAKQKGE